MTRRIALLAFLTWTVLVWTSRIRNVLADDDLSAGGTTLRLVAAAAFVLLGVLVALQWRRGGRLDRILAVLVLWTVVWWSVRGIGIIVDDHELGFTIVHTILGVVSIGLAMWAWARRAG
ncbi:MAG: hypothetical protein DHS20C19_07630 [Acidimicrobiales bacterium]|nr:MAG: hypothetical protein DHS20C19_07630 [Acidimicrobiales bacterium]